MTDQERKAKQKAVNDSPKGRFRSYRAEAKNRGIPFKLTFNQFMKFWNKYCKYCRIDILGVGLDRIDSTKGYELANVVACCKVCNRMKSNLTLDQFLQHIHRLARLNPDPLGLTTLMFSIDR